MNELTLNENNTTRLFWYNLSAIKDAGKRIIINRGSTSSSKNISIIQNIILLSRYYHKKKILMTSDDLPNLRVGAVNDFTDLIDFNEISGFGFNIANEYDHVKANNCFVHKFTKTRVHYKGMLKKEDAYGVKYDFIYMNEANRQPFDVFQQLDLRLKDGGKLIIDFNPDDEYCWINTEIEQKRDDFILLKSTYKDNHFLKVSEIRNIERLKTVDPELWTIFGCGEYGSISGLVYQNWLKTDDFPTSEEPVYGIDYGTRTTAIVKTISTDEANYAETLYYGPISKSSQIVDELKRHEVKPSSFIFTDHDPDISNHLYKEGYNVHNAYKKDMKDRILHLKSKPLFVKNRDVNLQKELNIYKFKQDRNGNYLDDVVRYKNHAINATEYAIYSYFKKFNDYVPLIPSLQSS